MLAAGLALPNVEQGIACEGTVLESRTLKVNGRAFLFLSPKKAYFKLGDSYAEAQAAGKKSSVVVPGGGGWTSLMWDGDCPVSDAVLRKWVKESYGLMGKAPAPKLGVGLLEMKPKKDGAKPAKGRGGKKAG